MSPALPKGTPIGRIETSLDWLLSHTSRFQGAIVVRIDTGEGVLLIEYGRPAAIFFRVGKRVIRGEAARRLLSQHKSINASLHRYTDHEFREALALLGPGARITVHGGKTEELPPFMNMFSQEERTRAEGESKTPFPGPGAENPDPVRHEPDAGTGTRTGAAVPAVRIQENTPAGILDLIAYTPGVSAAAIFREGSIVDSRGDDSLEELVEPAEEVLLSIFEVLALLSSGPLVQVTIRFFGRNVTIAPFNDGYLLVLTRPEVNLGQIRKLVHEVAEIGTA